MNLLKLKKELIEQFNMIDIDIVLMDDYLREGDYYFVLMWVDGASSILLFHSGLENFESINDVIAACKDNLETLRKDITNLLS